MNRTLQNGLPASESWVLPGGPPCFMARKNPKPAPIHYSRREYAEYLQSEDWARLRDLVLPGPGQRKCAFCKETPATQVHHLTYRNIYDVRKSDLKPVCDSCHGRIHALVKRRKISLGRWEHGDTLFWDTLNALNAKKDSRKKEAIGLELAQQIMASLNCRRIYGLLKYTPRGIEDLAALKIHPSKFKPIKALARKAISFTPFSRKGRSLWALGTGV